MLFHFLVDPDPGKSSGYMRIRIHNTNYRYPIPQNFVVLSSVSKFLFHKFCLNLHSFLAQDSGIRDWEEPLFNGQCRLRSIEFYFYQIRCYFGPEPRTGFTCVESSVRELRCFKRFSLLYNRVY